MGLIKTRDGWTHPDPGPCECGESRARRGFRFCRCASASGGGHPSWRCYSCDRVRTLGCAGAVPVSNKYGGQI